MSAELLRRAAAKMRENAEAANPGPWEAKGRSVETVHACKPNHGCFGVADTATYYGPDQWPFEKANAVHIASWHPNVALAVADLLDAVAEAWPVSEFDYATSLRAESVGHRQALTVARAYLGEA